MFASMLVALSAPGWSQASRGAAPQDLNGRVVLVLPFENRTGQKGLDWIGESFPETLNQAFSRAGFLPLTYDDRTYALDHLGLPANFRPSRATTYRLAQTLDADVVVVGSYALTEQRLTATAQMLFVKAVRMGVPLTQQAELSQLLDAEGSMGWHLAQALDPTFTVSQSDFIGQMQKPRLDAYENFNRGLVEADRNERMRHLKEAVRLAPTYAPASLALGKAYFAAQQWEQAAATLQHVAKTDPLGQEAAFYFGLASFYSGNYPRAEEAFASIAAQLPLPEVVNNQGVAASRHGKDGAAEFQQAIALDPEDADYHYNLAVALRRGHEYAAALKEAERAAALRPNDTEVTALLKILVKEAGSSSPAVAASKPTANDDAQPLERIKRTYNEASFKQAAFALEQMKAARGKGAL
jgi:tetratricopeptide (TPR) repeat protein/TolB-like protein